ncbi:uncharacterized protein TM35_000531300, partial [Trypanosoma theileri]
MALRYLFFVLTVAVCCACNCQTAVEAESLPQPSGHDNNHGKPLTLDSALEETPCDKTATGGEAAACKAVVKATLPLETVQGEETNRHTGMSADLQNNLIQPENAKRTTAVPNELGSAGSSSTEGTKAKAQLEGHPPGESEDSAHRGVPREGIEQPAENNVNNQSERRPNTVAPGTPQTPSDTDRVKSPEETLSSHEESDKRGANDAQRNTQPPEAPVTEPSPPSTSSENDGTQGVNSAETTPTNPANTNSD